MSGKVVDLAAWLANSYHIDGRRRQISARLLRRQKTKAALSGSRPGGGAA